MFNFEMAASRILWKKREMFINVSLNKKKFEDLTNFIQLRLQKVKIKLC